MIDCLTARQHRNVNFVGVRAKPRISIKPSCSGDAKKHSSAAVAALFIILFSYVSLNLSRNLNVEQVFSKVASK